MPKRRIRQKYHISYLPEDKFRPLRDAFEDRPICRHCNINRRICHAFDPSQAAVLPIVAREELQTHVVRHSSFVGLMFDGVMFDGAICSEFANRCTFWNGIIHARIMIQHYIDAYPEFVAPTKRQSSFVNELSNLVSGKGQCPMGRCKSLNIQTHTCVIIFQLAAILGHFMQPEHFPIMPLRNRP